MLESVKMPPSLVAPRVGAWIETQKDRYNHQEQLGRAPRGRVD